MMITVGARHRVLKVKLEPSYHYTSIRRSLSRGLLPPPVDVAGDGGGSTEQEPHKVVSHQRSSRIQPPLHSRHSVRPRVHGQRVGTAVQWPARIHLSQNSINLLPHWRQSFDPCSFHGWNWYFRCVKKPSCYSRTWIIRTSVIQKLL
jgi:hypothetical protein